MSRRVIVLALALLPLLLAGSVHGATTQVVGALFAWGQGGIMAGEEDDKLLEKGLTRLREGAYRKAVRVLTRANAEVDGHSLHALVGLSAAHNRLEEHAQAYSFAKEVLGGAQDASLRAAAGKELAYAIALGKVAAEKDELEEAFDEVRRYLALEPIGSFSSGLRQGLCSIRRQAGLTRSGAGGSSPLKVGERAEVPVEVLNSIRRQAGLSRTGAGGSSPLKVGEGVEGPVKVYRSRPSPEPSELRYLTKAEKAMILARIDVDGCVDSIEILDATSEVWAEIVVRQVARWVYRPATRDGQAIAATLYLEMNLSRNSVSVFRRP